MQAVVLMAGKGTRMAKHYEGPKQLLPVNGKPVVSYLLDNLPEEVDQLIFVVGGPHEQTIRDHFKSGEHNGRPITFVVQEEQLGLAHAYWQAKELINGRWLGAVADDIVDPSGIKALFDHDLAVLAYKVEDPSKFGVLVTDEEGNLNHAVEKPQEFISDLVWTGHMIMDESFFELSVEPSNRGEYETPDVWMRMIHERGAKIAVPQAGYWLPVNDKEQLEAAEEALKKL